MVGQRLIPFGKGAILASSLDFVNGYQAGHLTYMATMSRHPEPYTDSYITELFLDNLENMRLSSLFGIGYAIGWLATLASKEMKRSEPAQADSEERG